MHHDGDDGKHGKRFRLKVRHVVLGVFAALVLAGLLRMAILSSGANRRMEALRAAGQPTSLAELSVRNKLPMGMENAAPLYESAFAAYVPPGEDVNVPLIGRKTVPLPRGIVLSGPMAQVVADCLAANEKCLALLHQASAVETCRYEYEYGKASPKFERFGPVRVAQLGGGPACLQGRDRGGGRLPQGHAVPRPSRCVRSRR